MKTQSMKKVIGLLMLTVFLACSQEEDNFIDPELQAYFDSFKVEAAIRGIQVDYQSLGLDGVLQSLSSDGVKGQCQHNSDMNNAVIIDIDYWMENDHYSKEFLVFHELGHCVLDRRHLDEVDNNGHCISIMNSGSVTCRANYNDETRELFLNELFSEN